MRYHHFDEEMILPQIIQLRNDSEYHRTKSEAMRQSLQIQRNSKSIVWHVLILFILARGYRPISHLRLSDSTIALSNLTLSLVLSQSQKLGNVTPYSEKVAPTSTVLMASSYLEHTPLMSFLDWLLLRHWRFEARFLYLWLFLKLGAGVSYKMFICTFNNFLSKMKERKTFRVGETRG